MIISGRNGGSASESNRPAPSLTYGPTVLKTAATTRCASTSEGKELFSWLYPGRRIAAIARTFSDPPG